MSVIHTNKTGTGFNSGQTGAMADATNAPPPSPVLLPDLVAGWSLTAGPQQTLDSTGVIASGTYDLSNENSVTFGASGATFNGVDNRLYLSPLPAALDVAGNAILIALVYEPLSKVGLTLGHLIGSTSPTTRDQWDAYWDPDDPFDRLYFSRPQLPSAQNVQGPAAAFGAAYFAAYTIAANLVTLKQTSNVTSSTAVLNAAILAKSDHELEVGSSLNDGNYFNVNIKYLRMWIGPNAATIAANSTYMTWLANGGSGRTDAEVAAYTG